MMGQHLQTVNTGKILSSLCINLINTVSSIINIIFFILLSQTAACSGSAPLTPGPVCTSVPPMKVASSASTPSCLCVTGLRMLTAPRWSPHSLGPCAGTRWRGAGGSPHSSSILGTRQSQTLHKVVRIAVMNPRSV